MREYVTVRGWETVKEYVDAGISGKSISRRLAFQELLKEACQRKFDVVICHKIDRFARSTPDLLNSLQQLESAGVRFIATSQSGIDTDSSSPISRLLIQLLAVIGEFERNLIHERTQLGYHSYREDFRKGKNRQSKSGKNLDVGRPKKIFDRARIYQLKKEGLSIREIAKAVGVSAGTVVNVQKCGQIPA